MESVRVTYELIALLFFGTGHNFFVCGNAHYSQKRKRNPTAVRVEILFLYSHSRIVRLLSIVRCWYISSKKACAGHIKLLFNTKHQKH